MKVTGKFYKDQNEVHIITGEKPNRTYYSISRVTGQWGAAHENKCCFGGFFSSKSVDNIEQECTDYGTFELK